MKTKLPFEIHPALVAVIPSRKVSFSVRPRYSCGSPAYVDEWTALQVAADETWAFGVTMDGIYGETKRQVAEAIGLTDIVVANWQSGSKWFTLDLLTHELIQSRIKQGSIVRDRNDPIKVIKK